MALDDMSLKRKINAWENAKWRAEVESKSTLELCRRKIDIGEEVRYRNSLGSLLLY